MRWTAVLPIALAAALAAACDRGDRQNVNTNPNANPNANPEAVGTSGSVNEAPAADRDFVRDLGIANSAEIELGRLALDHASNRQVKEFAQLMIDDHTKARDALNAVASKHNLLTTAMLDQKHRELKDKLSQLKGADFDREYIDAMVDGHQDVLDKLESRVDKDKLADWKTQMKDAVTAHKEPASAVAVTPEHSDNPVTMDINQWAADTYPVVAGHLDKAQALNDTLNKRRSTE
jgi:putative membrane protein